jgi:hypothetical protein
MTPVTPPGPQPWHTQGMIKAIIWTALAFLVHPILGIVFLVAEIAYAVGKRDHLNPP